MSEHDARCARRLRADMLAKVGEGGVPPLLLEAIAATIMRCCGHGPLRAHRLAHGWTIEAAVAAVHEMCKEQELGTRGLTYRSWQQWETGEHPCADYQDLLCRLFRTSPVSLGFGHAYPQGDTGQGNTGQGNTGQGNTGQGNTGQGNTEQGDTGQPADGQARDNELPPEVGEMVHQMAYESLIHAATAELSDASPAMIESLEHEITRLARAYVHQPAFPLFRELVLVQREIRDLLDRRLRPPQRAQMLMLAGQACGLLAVASLDLGVPEAAAEQARSAWAYAQAAGHDGLSAWIRGTQAQIAHWTHDHDKAIAFARDGQRLAASATARTRLHAIEALACATAGARREATDALRAAERAQLRGQGADHVHDVIAGEFAFPPARLSYLAGSTYLRLHLPQLAIASASTAIRRYENGPATERSYGNESLARADLVHACVLTGDLDAARESATAIARLPAGLRVAGVFSRLRDAAGLLGEPRYQRAPQARQLIEQIGDFCQASPSDAPSSPHSQDTDRS